MPILAVVAAVLIGATAVLGYVALSDRRTAPIAQTAGATATATVTATAAAPTTTDTTPTTTTAAPNPLTALQSRAAADRSVVLATLNNRWVAQLSSKWSGVPDLGKTWYEADILGEIAYFDQRFGSVRVLSSADWSVYEHNRQYWIAIYAGNSWDSPEPAKAWCLQQSIDRDHCAAKLISDTHPVEGSTSYN